MTSHEKMTTVQVITMNLPLSFPLRCLIAHVTSSGADSTFAAEAKVPDAKSKRDAALIYQFQ
jgi:hypothetical protein